MSHRRPFAEHWRAGAGWPSFAPKSRCSSYASRLLMAQSRHAQCADECPLLGAKRTFTNRCRADFKRDAREDQLLAAGRGDGLGCETRGKAFWSGFPAAVPPAARHPICRPTSQRRREWTAKAIARTPDSAHGNRPISSWPINHAGQALNAVLTMARWPRSWKSFETY